MIKGKGIKYLNSLPKKDRKAIIGMIKMQSQKGEGVGDIVKMLLKEFGPLLKQVGPKVLTEIVVPFVRNVTDKLKLTKPAVQKKKKKPQEIVLKVDTVRRKEGKGLKLAGQGLVLAGQGAMIKPKRKNGKKKQRVKVNRRIAVPRGYQTEKPKGRRAVVQDMIDTQDMYDRVITM